MNDVNKKIIQCVIGAWATVSVFYWVMLRLFEGRVDQAIMSALAATMAPIALMWLAGKRTSPGMDLATMSLTALSIGAVTLLLFGFSATGSPMMLFISLGAGVVILVNAFFKDLDEVTGKSVLIAAMVAEILSIAATLYWMTPAAAS
ncbi:hypothetical protein HY633_03815 [Candidatus Uhrbacteria bacterium]|nr:hypothetical protein [Candidatus Uhrbacteria bacterium]